MNSRGMDVQDIDTELVGRIIINVMKGKGYDPFISAIEPTHGSVRVEEIMARYQSFDPRVDAFLFCYFSPALFFSDSQKTPRDHRQRSFSLLEMIQILQPGSDWVIWAGPRADRSPKNSISHAFIYLSMTLFKALDWQPLWEVADSQAGGKIRPRLAECPPAPTHLNYPANAGIIKSLMLDNLECRLRHIIPDSF